VIEPEHLLGPHPLENEKLKTLMAEVKGKIGWDSIKERFQDLIDRAAAQREQQLQGQETTFLPYHTLFLGPPGTGRLPCSDISNLH
jgi:hypothetical protein